MEPREAKKGFGDEIPKQVWDRSLPPPVADEGRRSVGNGKERLRDYSVSRIGSPTYSIAKRLEKSSQGAERCLTGLTAWLASQINQ